MLTPKFDKKKRVFAKAALQTYTYASKEPDKIRKINREMKKHGGNFKIRQRWSDYRISVFKSDNYDGRVTFIIAQRGTQPNRFEDLKSDLAIAFRSENKDLNINERMKRTEDIIEELLELFPNAQFYLSGHSLGALVVHYCMLNSKFIFNNVTKCFCFNMATTPLYVFRRLSKEHTKDEWRNKIEIHHVKGDFLSQQAKGFYEGKLFQYTVNDWSIINLIKRRIPFYRRYNQVQTSLARHKLENFLAD